MLQEVKYRYFHVLLLSHVLKSTSWMLLLAVSALPEYPLRYSIELADVAAAGRAVPDVD